MPNGTDRPGGCYPTRPQSKDVDIVDYLQCNTSDHATPFPRPPMHEYLPDPPLGMDIPQAVVVRPEQFLDEQWCAYNACPECCQYEPCCLCQRQEGGGQ
jgi:hypothetical protein